MDWACGMTEEELIQFFFGEEILLRIWEDNIKTKFGEVYCKDMKSTKLIWIRAECQDLVLLVSVRPPKVVSTLSWRWGLCDSVTLRAMPAVV
jgi:hypothetical protein